MKPLRATPFLPVLLLSGLATASSEREISSVPFPMIPIATGADEVLLQPIVHELEALADRVEVRLSDVPLPGGTRATLVLRQIRLPLAPGAIHVDGRPTAQRPDPTTSLWSGRVEGWNDSVAYLAFSRYGSRGWFGMAHDLHHLMASPAAQGGWSQAAARIVTSNYLDQAGFAPQLDCLELGSADPHRIPPQLLPGGPLHNPGPTPIYDAPIAFETDWEFYTLFNDLGAAQSYALSLIGAVSQRYREQVGVLFTIPYLGLYTSNNDPWTQTGCSARLQEFRSAWANGGAPVRAELYSMIAGTRVSGCGGVAYRPGLCSQSNGFSLSAHINGNLPFPPVQGPLTWDFMVLAHELGHNFNAPHTHSTSPQIDNCAGGDCSVTPNGTIMSYCHTCPGGMRNINLMFHPQIVTIMRNHVLASCLRPFRGLLTADLGHALAGSNGTPNLTLGFSTGPDRIRVSVSNAPSNRAGLVVLGASRIDLPFAGGVIVPAADIPLPVTANGTGGVAFSFPVGGSAPDGATFWAQAWFLDPSGSGWAATNGVEAEIILP